jgi:hypothetical protein
VLFAGLGAGAFLAFALNMLDPVFYSSTQLKNALAIPVFGTLPRRSGALVPDQLRPFAIGAGALVFVCIVVNVAGREGLAPLKQLLAG